MDKRSWWNEVYSLHGLPNGRTYLHYDEDEDLVYCHTCLRAFAEKQIKAANAYAAFRSVLANHEIK